MSSQIFLVSTALSCFLKISWAGNVRMISYVHDDYRSWLEGSLTEIKGSSKCSTHIVGAFRGGEHMLNFSHNDPSPNVRNSAAEWHAAYAFGSL